ncbi:hypothetical protein DM860_014996 [Cuscuta australis]|uniref:Uncharacterized protein n=1 Tax=Cuscuta australis TaxID=267555 RepID=A0A328DE49_9ASTE|nr:hypothetical protein DM860_014996 [Cuscuta australis]
MSGEENHRAGRPRHYFRWPSSSSISPCHQEAVADWGRLEKEVGEVSPEGPSLVADYRFPSFDQRVGRPHPCSIAGRARRGCPLVWWCRRPALLSAFLPSGSSSKKNKKRGGGGQSSI